MRGRCQPLQRQQVQEAPLFKAVPRTSQNGWTWCGLCGRTVWVDGVVVVEDTLLLSCGARKSTRSAAAFS